MSKHKTQINTVATPETGNRPSSDAGNLFKKYLYHWPLFILGLIVFVALAFFYLQVAKPVYPIMAAIEFKSPTAASTSFTVNQTSTEQTLDPIDKPVIVENEKAVMQSTRIIYQVVNNLQLWVTYLQKDGLLKKDLYKETPVKFRFLKQIGILDVDGIKLNITIKNDSSYTYKDYDNGETKNIKFSTPVNNSFGTWELNPTSNLSNYINSALVIKVEDPDLVSDDYQKHKIKVELEDKVVPFVSLSITDKVPQRGKDVLNAVMALYTQFSLNDKNKLSQKALNFIDTRLDSLRNELDRVEGQIERYKTSHGITVSVDTEAQHFQNVKQINVNTLNDVEVQLRILDVLEKYANSPENSEKLPVVSGSLSDPGLSAIYDKLSDLQIKRQSFIGNTPDKNPMVQTVISQISTLKNDFKEKILGIKSSLQAQKDQLASIISGSQSFLNNVPGEDRELTILKRYQESKQSVYRFLLAKREQIGLHYAQTISDSEIIDDAHAGAIKWPIIPLVYLIAIILGLGSAAGILYLREILNEFIISRKQIEEKTEVPILGELFYQKTNKHIVVAEGRGKLAIGEQFRLLRTNLYHLHGNNDGGRVTLFTSSVSSEGKSFVSSNLAVTLAYASRKTIILEMDFHNPKISVIFGLSPKHPGISNYLNEESSNLQQLIQPSGIAGLDVLGCGHLLPNSSELLEKEKLDELMAALRKMYDDIIIDSPPIHLVSDALIMARVADVYLYLVRQGYTHKDKLEFINQMNEAKRFPKFTIIFNGIKSGAGYGGYSSSYNHMPGTKSGGFGDRLKGVLMRF